ncbi:MAG: uracil-DNA glycosylase [Steroidobacteraceae bacterium]
MIDARQAAYLEALGVDVYLPRGQALLAVPSEDQQPAMPGRAGSAPAHAGVVRPRAAPAEALDEPQDLDGFGWEQLQAAVAACTRCELHGTRTQTVFGVGDRQARWMFIGEAPGQDEDRQGEPFVGRAGQLLNQMIRSVGMQREDVYIANVVKCRPPGNRDPRPAEAASCRGFLERQVALVNPAIVIAVGRIAAQNLLMTETPIAKLRGKVHTFGARGWPLLVMYHPAYLLRTPSEKRKAWQDLLQAKRLSEQLAREAAGKP